MSSSDFYSSSVVNPTIEAPQDSVNIRFLGGAGTVTGSKHLLQIPGYNILVDCGLFQGIKPLRILNWEDPGLDPASVNVVLLTHAHLDHCGYLPLLVKNGFKGKIYMSKPTAELAGIILQDSATLQEEDADRANREGYSRHHPALPLYDRHDVANTIPLFVNVEKDVWIDLHENVRFRFRGVGHILGACFIEMDCYGKRIVFSGDVGRKNTLTIPDPERPEEADYLIIESTYGNRLHPDDPADMSLSEIINETMHKGGNLLLPSFAVGRAQELMALIHDLKKRIMIPDVPVYLDSPMGERATEVMTKNLAWQKLSREESTEIFGDVHFVKKEQDTFRLIAEKKRKKIIIAASGMLSGGRVLYYLKEYLPDIKNTILLVGFQPEGTRGRDLVDKAHELRIHGEFYPVNAEVRELMSLSAHADQAGLLDWVSQLKNKPELTFIVHGEASSSNAFRLKLQYGLGWNVEVPVLGQGFELFKISSHENQ